MLTKKKISRKKIDFKIVKKKKSQSKRKFLKSKKRNFTSHFHKKRNPEFVIERNPSLTQKKTKS